MLENLLDKLKSEFEDRFLTEKTGLEQFKLKLRDGLEIEIIHEENMFYLSSHICALPETRREELFIYLMKANLFGEGTAGCVLGLTQDEKFLTISLQTNSEINFKTFKEKFEDFLNYQLYWNEEVIQFATQENIL